MTVPMEKLENEKELDKRTLLLDDDFWENCSHQKRAA
jgi:hypothetical protein